MSLPRRAILVVGSFLAAGCLLASCQKANSSESERSEQTLEASEQKTPRLGDQPDERLDEDFDPERERAIKKRWQEKRRLQTQRPEIDWDSAERWPKLQTVPFDDTQRETLARPGVPVLLPNRTEWLQAATLTSHDHWYAASMAGDGVTVYVSGTHTEIVAPGVDERPFDPEKTRVTRNELIPSLTFRRFGVSYTVEIICASPGDDARCQDETFIRRVADSLVRVGGLR